jgi:hypothetical protein
MTGPRKPLTSSDAGRFNTNISWKVFRILELTFVMLKANEIRLNFPIILPSTKHLTPGAVKWYRIKNLDTPHLTSNFREKDLTG